MTSLSNFANYFTPMWDFTANRRHLTGESVRPVAVNPRRAMTYFVAALAPRTNL
jgi:hypothetical protein